MLMSTVHGVGSSTNCGDIKTFPVKGLSLSNELHNLKGVTVTKEGANNQLWNI